jgi:ATP-binding cassette, subfamily F, member 3
VGRRVHAEQADIETTLADPAIYEEASRDRLRELLKRQGELRQRAEALEAAWMEAEADLESAQKPG